MSCIAAPYSSLLELPVAVPRSPSRAALYWKRRAVALAFLLSVLAGLALVAHVTVGALATDRAQPQLVTSVSAPHATQWSVAAGDTLWSIAVATHPSEDPRPVVAAMRKAGAPAQLQVGDLVTVP